MVFSVMKLFIPAERRAEAVEILAKMHGRLEIYTDHLGSWIQERDHPCSDIVYIEHWKSEEAIFDHIRRLSNSPAKHQRSIISLTRDQRE
jgi:hypothetical protein